MAVINFSDKNINPKKLDMELRSSLLLLSKYGHLEMKGLKVAIITNSDLTTEELDGLNLIFSNHTIDPGMDEIIEDKLNAVDEFVKKIMTEFVRENIKMGITQQGKTRMIAETLRDINYFMQSGSLHEVLQEIETIRSGINPSMEPFITNDRLDKIKSKIEVFLAESA